mmetsp:Transcript_3474/g.10878  ORF Transcript_3474/g.10878 Transcript_3474/m.10878 type:complete len:294 (+) Transcript_3474:1563-2444(+)
MMKGNACSNTCCGGSAEAIAMRPASAMADCSSWATRSKTPSFCAGSTAGSNDLSRRCCRRSRRLFCSPSTSSLRLSRHRMFLTRRDACRVRTSAGCLPASEDPASLRSDFREEGREPSSLPSLPLALRSASERAPAVREVADATTPRLPSAALVAACAGLELASAAAARACSWLCARSRATRLHVSSNAVATLAMASSAAQRTTAAVRTRPSLSMRTPCASAASSRAASFSPTARSIFRTMASSESLILSRYSAVDLQDSPASVAIAARCFSPAPAVAVSAQSPYSPRAFRAL